MQCTEHARTRRDLVLAEAFFASRSECKRNLLQQGSFSVPFFSKQSFSHVQKKSCGRHIQHILIYKSLALALTGQDSVAHM